MKKGTWPAGILAVSFGLAGVLAGCSSDKAGTSDSESKSKSKEEQVTLDVFQFKVEFKKEFETVAKAYEEENKNVKINITTVGGGEDYGAALRSKFASGNEPAIYNIGGPQDVEDWNDKLADLSDSAAAKAALAGTLDGVTVDGKVLGLPYNQEGYGLIYNKNVFEKAGIDPASITDFASLEAAVKELDSKKGDLGLEAVFALPGALNSIPRSLDEAATIDGANKFQVFWYIIFPMLKPITVTVAILNTIWIWNDYLLPSLVINKQGMETIPLKMFFSSENIQNNGTLHWLDLH